MNRFDGLFGEPGKNCFAGILFLILMGQTGLFGQSSCPAPSGSDFRVVDLTMSDLSSPSDMELAPDGRIFISEIYRGEIKIFRDGGSPRMVTAGRISVANSNEHGLQSFTLDPNFEENGWIYIRYSPPGRDADDEVARFTMNGDVLDVDSRKILLTIPKETNAHLGAGMAFDSQGNLLITTGCDTSPRSNQAYGAFDYRTPTTDGGRSAANTMDFRGKILRIKPIPFSDSETPSPGIGSTYEIPAKNLWETIEATMPETDMSLVKKEILAMGFRNPYRIAVKPNTDWIYTAEVGPDAGRDSDTRGRAGHDEINLTKPGGGFYGWPYCNGNNYAYNIVDYSGGSDNPTDEKWDCDAPVNTSPLNTGITNLPPAIPPIIWYAGSNMEDFQELGSGQETAMVGPFYQYDPDLDSDVKFPPFYHNTMIFWDWARFTHKMIRVNSEGGLDKIEDFPVNGHEWGSDIDIIFGANGAMYVLQWSENGYGGGPKAFYKVEYTGSLNEESCPLSLASSEFSATSQNMFSAIMGVSRIQLPEGALGLEAYNIDGQKIWSYSRNNNFAQSEWISLPGIKGTGIVQIRIIQ